MNDVNVTDNSFSSSDVFSGYSQAHVQWVERYFWYTCIFPPPPIPHELSKWNRFLSKYEVVSGIILKNRCLCVLSLRSISFIFRHSKITIHWNKLSTYLGHRNAIQNLWTVLCLQYYFHEFDNGCRDQFAYALSQWETRLHCHVVSHRQNPCADWSLRFYGFPVQQLSCHIYFLKSSKLAHRFGNILRPRRNYDAVSNSFPWTKHVVFWFQFHRNLFLSVQLIGQALV